MRARLMRRSWWKPVAAGVALLTSFVPSGQGQPCMPPCLPSSPLPPPPAPPAWSAPAETPPPPSTEPSPPQPQAAQPPALPELSLPAEQAAATEGQMVALAPNMMGNLLGANRSVRYF